MRQALDLAASVDDDVPVAAIVADEDGRIIGRGVNTRERDGDPTGHAEINAIRQAAQNRGQWRLEGCDLVVTLEPCTMCASAMVSARGGWHMFGDLGGTA